MEVQITQRRYLGSKTKLLTFIEDILEKEGVKYDSFADLFAGTGTVANYFHRKASIVVNDLLESNYQCYLAFFSKESLRVPNLLNRLSQYNSIETAGIPENYFSRNFANTYFDAENAKRIGHIREDIEQLFLRKKINAREKAYLVTSLIYALDRIANTVGHYDAYRKVSIPSRKLELRPLSLGDSKYDVSIHKRDANELAGEVRADVVYLDPPYNSRQYSDSYHLLENIACWEKQEVFGVAKKIDRAHLKSAYSLKSAGNAFSDLINDLNAKYILVSYNDMGTNGNARSQSRISDHEIMSALERRGEVKVYEKAFNQFTTGSSTNSDLKERVFFCRVRNTAKHKPSVPSSDVNTHLPIFVKSPLNYTGGKHKLLPQLTKFFPPSIDTFYDVFCGGANVGLNATANKIVCIDKSARVIELLRFIQKSNFEDLNQELLNIIKKHGLSQSYINGYGKYDSASSSGLGHYNKNAYIALRNEFNSSKLKDKSVLLLALILYGFNNQIRFNSKGEYNLPVGKRDYNGSSRKNLAHFNAITNVKNIVFENGDFQDLNKKRFTKDDFVYLDPPYLLGLASYNESGGWSLKDEISLYDVLGDLHAKGVRFALSNVVEHKGQTNKALLDFVKKNRLKMNPIDHTYKNSNYQSKAKENLTREVLVTNYIG